MTDQITSPQTTELFEAMLSLKTVDECRSFFRDLCTIGEIEAMTERFQVAKLIDQKIPYREISRQTGSSTATITRVAHWMHHGMGGYRLMLDRAT
ncbi:hypothetical protein AUK40_04680 [Candidatus Wirthbacteria bacterium CG2_30_54_11]|uniref:TrpR, YerC/YecD n=1 Tax=Candidatus Wirthbacteria bacterium CG2_30_54_11 TaxID=1817892 RepID=A0A1J5IQM6_9BACT|nr:MAG: hypothetical protein AUK40_04680 [Candidatus Wirthbacteria bacterium CG2_30_54_11]